MTSSAAVAAEWARCRAWLTPALSDATEAVVLAELAAGRAQLWPGARSAGVTQLLLAEEPFLHIWIAGGDMRELVAMVPGLAAWARAQGARSLRVNGRKGWSRVLQGAGFEMDGDELRRGLSVDG